MRLSVIINQLAAKHGLSVFFNSDYDPIFDRFDQKKQSDLAFILKMAEYAGLQVRLSHGKLIVYQDSLFDRQDVALTITKNYDGQQSHQFRASSADIYTACHVQYLDSRANKLMTYQFAPEGDSGVLESDNSTSDKSSGSGSVKIDQTTLMVIPSSNTANTGAANDDPR